MMARIPVDGIAVIELPLGRPACPRSAKLFRTTALLRNSAPAAWASSTGHKRQRLGRTVALKFLPDAMASDRESHVISSLNHPHICSLYDVGEAEGQPILAMEYPEGETLAARLAQAVGAGWSVDVGPASGRRAGLRPPPRHRASRSETVQHHAYGAEERAKNPSPKCRQRVAPHVKSCQNMCSCSKLTREPGSARVSRAYP